MDAASERVMDHLYQLVDGHYRMSVVVLPVDSEGETYEFVDKVLAAEHVWDEGE